MAQIICYAVLLVAIILLVVLVGMLKRSDEALEKRLKKLYGMYRDIVSDRLKPLEAKIDELDTRVWVIRRQQISGAKAPSKGQWKHEQKQQRQGDQPDQPQHQI